MRPTLCTFRCIWGKIAGIRVHSGTSSQINTLFFNCCNICGLKNTVLRGHFMAIYLQQPINMTSMSRRIIMCQLKIYLLNCHILREAFTDSQATLILFQNPLFFFFIVFIKICNQILISTIFFFRLHRTGTIYVGLTIADPTHCRVSRT